MILEQIRAALPTHIMLTPGVHKWREWDEWKSHNTHLWVAFDSDENGANEGIFRARDCRRPIPPHILDNQAFWLRFEYMQTRRLFTGRNTILINRDADDATLAKGRLYDKWLLEQMEGV